MTTQTNADRVGKALRLYSDEMKTYVLGRLKAHYGEGREWLEAYLGSFKSESRRENVIRTLQHASAPEEVFDVIHIKDLFLGNRDVFYDDFKRSFNRAVTWADEITDVRHSWAHHQVIDPDDLTRTLDSIARILTKIGSKEAAKTVKNLRDDVQPEAPPSGSLSAWWQLVTPHEDIRKGNFDENTFAAKLDDVVSGKAPPEYLLAYEFYQKTYLTHELKGLLVDTLRRLAGTGGEAVVQLRTPFGGGKTHALISLYHLIKKAADIEDLAEVQGLLEAAGLKHVPNARTAVLVGTDLSAQGRTAEDGTELFTLWGELAYQLGGKEGYALVEADDKARTSPGKDRLRRLLETYSKALILMDEVLVYQVKAAGVQVGDTSLQAQTFSFFQELSETVGSVPGVALITTFPESNAEYYDHEQAPQVFERLEKIFGRVQSVRIPVQGEEIFEVVRRRLFEHIDDDKARGVIAQYRQLYTAHREDLPSEVRSSSYEERMSRAFPFHPELISVLYERWGTLQTFQKTRGVLRLLARVIEYSYSSNAARPLISLGDVGLEEPDLRAIITSILKDANWDPVIASDIAPGKAIQLDKEVGGEYLRNRLSLAITSAIFVYSHSGGGSERGVTEPRLRLALLQPQGITTALISDALARMKDKLYYLYGNGGWSFKAQPNLNAVLAERVSQVKMDLARERLADALHTKAGSGLLKPFIWPGDHKDVPDNTQLKMVLLGPDHNTDAQEACERIRSVIQNNASGGPRINKNTLVYLSGERRDFTRALEAARTLIALEDVSGDRGLVLSKDQREDLTQRLGKIGEQLPELAKACYTVLYEPLSADGEVRIHLIGAAIKTQPNVQSAVIDTLRSEDRLLSALDPALLLQFEPYQLWRADAEKVTLRNLRDYFDRYPHLPMLESADVLKEAAIKGVRNGYFEAAMIADGEPSRVWRRGEAPRESDLFLGDHYVLARPGHLPVQETAQADGAPRAEPEPNQKGQTTTPPEREKASEIRRLELNFDSLSVDQISELVNVFGALQDAGGEVTIRVTMVAENSAGLDETMLDINVKEVLAQSGLSHSWEAS